MLRQARLPIQGDARLSVVQNQGEARLLVVQLLEATWTTRLQQWTAGLSIVQTLLHSHCRKLTHEWNPQTL